MRRAVLALLGALGGCAGAPDAHVPPFARVPYAPFSREAAVAIALREWRLFGQPVDDDPPGTRVRPPPELRPEREPGLWQRVGEYWWLGMDAGVADGRYTGKHDGEGRVFPPGQDALYAWSAAFISYVMRIAGAGAGFPYSPNHAFYIDAARRGVGRVRAERPTDYAPQAGDLICEARSRAHTVTFDDLPTDGFFPGHCDIVVAVAAGLLDVIGGNVDDAVTMKHVPTTPAGMLAGPDGMVVDTRYPWFVVVRVLYDPEGLPAAPVV